MNGVNTPIKKSMVNTIEKPYLAAPGKSYSLILNVCTYKNCKRTTKHQSGNCYKHRDERFEYMKEYQKENRYKYYKYEKRPTKNLLMEENS